MANVNTEQIKELLKDQQVRKYLVAGGIILITVFFFTFNTIPGLFQFITLATMTSDMEAQINAAENKISRIDDMERKVEELKEDLGKHSKHLPAEKEITSLLEGFAFIADRADIKILSVTPYELKKISTGNKYDKFYREMPIKITAKGGYHQLGHFINKLEKEKRVIIIDDLEIKYDKQTPRMHDIVIMVKTYVSIE